MKCDKKDLLLYAVTDRRWLGEDTLYHQVEEAILGGATFIQLREKELSQEAFLEEAKEIKELCRKYQIPFVINDNVEIAREMDADGVHVGQSDMEAGNVREVLGPERSLLFLNTNNFALLQHNGFRKVERYAAGLLKMESPQMGSPILVPMQKASQTGTLQLDFKNGV